MSDEDKELMARTCDFCEKVCKNPRGKASHMAQFCTKNPNSKAYIPPQEAEDPGQEVDITDEGEVIKKEQPQPPPQTAPPPPFQAPPPQPQPPAQAPRPQPKKEPEEPKETNWNKVALFVVIIVAIIAICVSAYLLLRKPKPEPPKQREPPQQPDAHPEGEFPF